MSNNDPPTYGLTYPDNYISSLPAAPGARTPLLPLADFAALHLKHTLAHPPDHVLFPFLHGLEGENQAQNTFFASADRKGPAPVPRYRGLLWVVADEDLPRRRASSASAPPTPALEYGEDSDENYSSDESNYSDSDEERDMDVDIMDPVSPPEIIQVVPEEKDKVPLDEQPHMHPVIQTSNLHTRPAPDSPVSAASSSGVETTAGQTPELKMKRKSRKPTLLTSTFYPRDLLRPTFDSGWEFVPPRIPDGISLRNFGIQVPIYATLCDIVVYSPHGRSSANAQRLAERFREAIVRKRVQRLRGRGAMPSHDADDPAEDDESELLKYNVFILDADDQQLNTEVPWLVVRYPEDGLLPSDLHKAAPTMSPSLVPQHGAPETPKSPTIVSDADVEARDAIPPAVVEATVVPQPRSILTPSFVNSAKAASDGSSQNSSPNPQRSETDDLNKWYTTIDFAQREKDEMRELTMAKEILSFFPPPPPQQPAPRLPTITSPLPSPGLTNGGSPSPFDRQSTASPASTVPSPPPTSRPSSALRIGSPEAANGRVASPPTTPRPIIRSYNSQEAVSREGMSTSLPSGRQAPVSPPHMNFGPSSRPASRSTSPRPNSAPHPLSLSNSSTQTHFDSKVGQVFLGNSNDVPLGIVEPLPLSQWATSPVLPTDTTEPLSITDTLHSGLADGDPFNFAPSNSPSDGYGYDIAIECHDLAPWPTAGNLRAAEEHLGRLESAWATRCVAAKRAEIARDGVTDAPKDPEEMWTLPTRPPPNANAIIHLPFPSSPPSNTTTVGSLTAVTRFLERWLTPPAAPGAVPMAAVRGDGRESARDGVAEPADGHQADDESGGSKSRRWSTTSAAQAGFIQHGQGGRMRSMTSPAPSPSPTPGARPPPHADFTYNYYAHRTRPLKVLLYSADGYTESSVPALFLLMTFRGLTLPEAYLELQVEKKRSFFVYSSDLGVLRRVEARLLEGGGHTTGRHRVQPPLTHRPSAKSISYATGMGPQINTPAAALAGGGGSSSFGVSSSTASLGSAGATMSAMGGEKALQTNVASPPRARRPRASTSPWLPSLFGGDHQAWFNDPRFDGSFPSRVLPFLYLGNLNHASNAYMLHALGITHVVSVGECALVPPAHGQYEGSEGSSSCHVFPGKGNQGSLWIEEREGRIKVLDIKGVCDDGIDTLEPQLEPICDWIDKARAEGGQVLVHCRVGVSRSATVVIAYAMKHLNIPLVDAYLIVRSRRLSVLIQPNMRLLYNLCGWEIKLARERAGDDPHKLRFELARTLSWPYLAKEVHALNEKYLH
ncbi:hypothetical protein EV714DRAFT_251914 [Schizophyllum commune]